MASHKNFLCSVATQGGKLSAPILTATLKDFFQTPKPELISFSKKMAEAISYCRLNKKSFFNGKKTSEQVAAVINAFPKTGSSEDLDMDSSPAEVSISKESLITCSSSSSDEEAKPDTTAEKQNAEAMLQKTMAMFSSAASSSNAPPKQQKRLSDASPVPAKKKSAVDSPVSVSSEEEEVNEKVTQ